MIADQITAQLSEYNQAYRAGSPIISDREYDDLVLKLKDIEPNHPFFSQFEPEPEDAFPGAKKVKHPIPMLSTDKAYTADEIASYVKRVEKAAASICITPSDIIYKATPKLDGLAGRQLNGQLVTRGESHTGAGYDISRIFQYGVTPAIEPENTPSVIGEIVVDQQYYLENLEEEFDHPRGAVIGLASAAAQNGTPNQAAMQAVKDGAIHFFTYDRLDEWRSPGTDLIEQIDVIFENLTSNCPFKTDGIVIEVVDQSIKDLMGHNNDFHRWQIAKKVRGEQKETRVLGITWQTSRTSRVNPVINIEPTKVDGRTMENPTGHYAGRIRDMGIDKGAKLLISFAGDVIPHVDKILEPVEAHLPTECPCCGTELEWVQPAKKNEAPKFLMCPNIAGCSAQTETAIKHFFHIIANVDLFGPATIRRLTNNGIDQLPLIFKLAASDFEAIGFGPGQSANLQRQAERCRTEPVEDWRFLGAFGLRQLGRGTAKRILQHHAIEDIHSLEVNDLVKIDGFAEKKATIIVEQLADRWPLIWQMMTEIGFALNKTPLLSETAPIESPIAGKNIVFTGAMESGSRDDMKSNAQKLGANVQSSVNGKTDWLVCGGKVGASKMGKAEKLGVTILTEAEYLGMLQG